MKKALLIILCVILLSGCDITQLQPNKSPEPIPTTSMPFQMDFKDFKISVADYSVTETLDEIGYTTVIDFKIEFDKSLAERDIRWILKDDLEGYYSLIGKAGNPDKSGAIGAYGIPGRDLDPGYTICGNIVFYSAQVQYQGRYSGENAELKLGFSYDADDTLKTALFSAVVTPERMIKTDEKGVVTAGELAQKYLSDKESLIK